MAKANFYLKETQSDIVLKDQKETLIVLYFRYDGFRLQYSTGETIHPKFWNSEAQRVKKSFSGSLEINHLLDRIDGEVKKIYREAITNDQKITNEYLITKLNGAINPVNKKEKSFFGYFDEFSDAQKPTKSPRTIQKYTTLKNHLMDFQAKKHFSISFEKIDTRFYELLTSYYISDLKLLNNSTSKYIKTLKTFLNWATDRGINTNISYQKFKAQEKDADIICLTEDELFKLYYLDLTDNKKLSDVRDTFCFGCFTGLRYSDIQKNIDNASKTDSEIFKLLTEMGYFKDKEGRTALIDICEIIQQKEYDKFKYILIDAGGDEVRGRITVCTSIRDFEIDVTSDNKNALGMNVVNTYFDYSPNYDFSKKIFKLDLQDQDPNIEIADIVQTQTGQLILPNGKNKYKNVLITYSVS